MQAVTVYKWLSPPQQLRLWLSDPLHVSLSLSLWYSLIVIYDKYLSLSVEFVNKHPESGEVPRFSFSLCGFPVSILLELENQSRI